MIPLKTAFHYSFFLALFSSTYLLAIIIITVTYKNQNEKIYFKNKHTFVSNTL